MKFNYAKEWAIFQQLWNKNKQEMESLGMSEADIQKVYDFDLAEFKSYRNYCLHKEDFNFMNNEDFLATKMKVYQGGQYEIEDNLGLLDRIENLTLHKAVKSLKSKDYEILLLYFVYGYTQEYLAQFYGVTQANLSKKIKRIKKYLKNFF